MRNNIIYFLYGIDNLRRTFKRRGVIRRAEGEGPLYDNNVYNI